jgi:hypothetical protein
MEANHSRPDKGGLADERLLMPLAVRLRKGLGGR